MTWWYYKDIKLSHDRMPAKNNNNEDVFTADEVMEMFVFIKEEINALREDFDAKLTDKIGASEHRIMAYIDKAVGRVDMKLDALIRILGDKQVLSPVDVSRIHAMGL